jgi:chromate transporter
MTSQSSKSPSSNNRTNSRKHALGELALLFLRLGFTAFGGPAAHIAMMRDEVVNRREWMDDQHFLDLVGATNLIPGPNSTEMAIHTGYLRAGFAGLIVAGTAFIFPAMLIVLALSWVYVRFGTTPAAENLLYGIQPIVIAIIAQALIGLGRRAVSGILTAFVGLGVLILYFVNVNEIALLFGGGAVVMILENLPKIRDGRLPSVYLPISGSFIPFAALATFSYSTLFLTFLKIGAVLYGSGYVLLAFLRADFVDRLGWLTDKQLIDAVAIGQITPGPVFTTATFIGYLLGGFPGAILSTIGIFLPSFVFVAVSNPLIPKIRQSAWAGSLLDGINVASLALMAAVTWQLGQAAIVDPITAVLVIVSAVLLFRYNVNSTWLILGGGITGLLRYLFS